MIMKFGQYIHTYFLYFVHYLIHNICSYYSVRTGMLMCACLNYTGSFGDVVTVPSICHLNTTQVSLVNLTKVIH